MKNNVLSNGKMDIRVQVPSA